MKIDNIFLKQMAVLLVMWMVLSSPIINIGTMFVGMAIFSGLLTIVTVPKEK